ncbi:extensin-like [Lolium rigidum]|uniref:extensin-like n=1 Tax=Lolium rigidum TaxID=89674 RepID=UPI001F5E02AD|nr:extensin-like [Lolium rigidum]
METLVISQQQQQRSHHHHSGRRRRPSPHFSSPHPMRGYQAVNCRAFHSSVSIGILPSPPTPPPSRPTRNYSPEPKTPKQQQQLHNGKKRSRAIPITPSGSPPAGPELWAGPAYSNSPPPSSLPIPKFSSLHQKRSVSLELPPADRSDHVELLVHAKSAPSTPTAGSTLGFFGDDDTAIATENLRRILHLDIA